VICAYEFQEKIESGHYAYVYKAIHQPTQTTVVIKIICNAMLDTEQRKSAISMRLKF
jgi:serine/threonine protein kinase